MNNQTTKNPFIEKLAECSHNSWINWMDYIFMRCSKNPDGSMEIPAELVYRWSRLTRTEYKDLTEDEKKSDRLEAEDILKAINEFDFGT